MCEKKLFTHEKQSALHVKMWQLRQGTKSGHSYNLTKSLEPAKLLLQLTTLQRLPLPTELLPLSCGYLRHYLTVEILQPTAIPPCFLANVKANPCGIELMQLLPAKDAWN